MVPKKVHFKRGDCRTAKSIERLVTDATYIPKVSEEEIRARSNRIKPVMQFKTGKVNVGLWRLKPVRSIFRSTFTWYPLPAEPVLYLQAVRDIRTYHRKGHKGVFRPLIAEILAQIPEEDLMRVVAFELVSSPHHEDDFGWDQKAFEAGYHVATVRLYIQDPLPVAEPSPEDWFLDQA